MKNLVVFLLVVFSLFFVSSCKSSKFAVQEVAVNALDTLPKKEFKVFMLGMFENYHGNRGMLDTVQFYSGPDTIVLQKSIEIATSSVADDGTLLIMDGIITNKAIILPNTPGTVDSIILSDDKTIKEILVCFSKNEKNSLSFVPVDDKFGTFLLSQNETKTVNGNDSPLMIKLFYMKEQDEKVTIEPGRLVSQKKATTSQKIPDKKFARN